MNGAANAADATSSGPSLGDQITAAGLQLNAYVDTGYSYLSGSGLFSSGVADRVFDTEPSSFNLH